MYLKTIDDIARENDFIRRHAEIGPGPRCDVWFSERVWASPCLSGVLRALREFSDFGALDEEHDLGKFFVSDPADICKGNYFVFSMKYVKPNRTEIADPYFDDQTVRVIRVMTLDELAKPDRAKCM